MQKGFAEFISRHKRVLVFGSLVVILSVLFLIFGVNFLWPESPAPVPTYERKHEPETYERKDEPDSIATQQLLVDSDGSVALTDFVPARPEDKFKSLKIDSCTIGRGGQGHVCKGVLEGEDGTKLQVAVKYSDANTHTEWECLCGLKGKPFISQVYGKLTDKRALVMK